MDPDFGKVRVPRIVGAYDAGRVVNPKLARSQVIGGMVGGLGMALLEEAEWGLAAAEAFFPAGAGDGWVSLGIYRFRDRAAVEAALGSPGTERVMADVGNFTDAEVTRSLFLPL